MVILSGYTDARGLDARHLRVQAWRHTTIGTIILATPFNCATIYHRVVASAQACISIKVHMHTHANPRRRRCYG